MGHTQTHLQEEGIDTNGEPKSGASVVVSNLGKPKSEGQTAMTHQGSEYRIRLRSLHSSPSRDTALYMAKAGRLTIVRMVIGGAQSART